MINPLLTLTVCLKIETEFLNLRSECIAYRGGHVRFFFSQTIIKESLPSLLTVHGRKFCIIAYLMYSLTPALGPQCHHFVPQYIGIML